ARHPLVVESMREIGKGGKLPPLAQNAQAGAAEALYGLGASLGRQGGEDLALVYLQLAIYLAPEQPLALLSLADLYENLKMPQLPIKAYQRVPEDSSLRRNAEIQLAVDLDALDRTEEAKSHLDKLVAARPNDLEAVVALGNLLRGRKQFKACADVYGKGSDMISKPDKQNWLIFYFRGICYERSKQWDRAEADLKKALELYPDQPHVLNYLGYSWVDQGINLDDGMRMIKRAVEQRPDDGYIVDSLGWAFYRIAPRWSSPRPRKSISRWKFAADAATAITSSKASLLSPASAIGSAWFPEKRWRSIYAGRSRRRSAERATTWCSRPCASLPRAS